MRIWIFLISPTQEIKSVHRVVADLEETDKKFDYEEFFANVEDVFQGAFCQTNHEKELLEEELISNANARHNRKSFSTLLNTLRGWLDCASIVKAGWKIEWVTRSFKRNGEYSSCAFNDSHHKRTGNLLPKRDFVKYRVGSHHQLRRQRSECRCVFTL